MTQTVDDLEAVRAIIKTLDPFEQKDKERIIRWVLEKLGQTTPSISQTQVIAGLQDLSETDLHVKVRQFLKKSGLTVGLINQIFYKEGTEIKPLYDDLKSTKAAESQIRISLLHALKNAITTGDFKFNGEDVRAETQLRKCYDAANFAATFKYNKDMFDVFTKYKKNSPFISLSSKGKERLAEVIKELQ